MTRNVVLALVTLTMAVGAAACGGDTKGEARAEQLSPEAESQKFHCGPPDYAFEDGQCYVVEPHRGSGGSTVVSAYICPWFWPNLYCTPFGDCYCY
jgi:hypothetical protein